MKSVLFYFLLVIVLRTNAQSTENLRVHDPVMAKSGDKYYLFATGTGISVWSSDDLKNWKKENAVFSSPPTWTTSAFPEFKGHFWAPDISYHNGQYYLHYSVSAFGKNTSCIGLATNVTLNPEDPDFKWVDRGMVIRSYPGVSNWNAIDPNIIEDEQGNAFMSFGSFWGGLKLVQLTNNRLSIAQDSSNLPTIASRTEVKEISEHAGQNAIEAPFIFKKSGYYYLFASIDYCCRGKESTYKMIVGRSKSVTGPYYDDQGIDLAKGGGKLLLAGDARWQGVGHNSIYTFEGADYLVFHAYDGYDNGAPKLRIETVIWDNQGWPKLTLVK